ncbi:glycohydrolase toxin TNT-related protein [Actinocrispum sp. NPDC049592]|uniref:glycohydrolase toxin TNT-related protein n=1 Tax=Actinocrispum sp. NPDC049592 TaxID=3154835 RepID=UPI00341660A3
MIVGIDGDVAAVVTADAVGFESVVTLRVERADGSEVDDADVVTGHVATGVRLVREETVPVAGWIPWVPTDPAPDGDPNSASVDVLAGLGNALAQAAPAGWSGMTVECEALVSRMVVTVTVSMADGTTLSWAPPAMVSQWLYRLRMRDYHPGRGVWFRARFELSPGMPLVRDVDALTPPSSVTPELAAAELQLLPRNADAIPRWLLDAAVRAPREDEPDGQLEMVRLFDGPGVVYRPVLSEDEREAVLEYLTAAPLVLSSRGLTEDVLAGNEEPVVPMGFHTDGRFVWPSSAAYYLSVHGVPPALPLVSRIRAKQHRPTVNVPAIVMDRAAALAMGRPWDESEVDIKANEAFRVVESVIIDKRISPRYYSVLAEREGAWNLVRDGDRYRVQWSQDQRSAIVFDDVRQASAYLAGQLTANAAELEYELGEEIPAWQSPLVVLSDDPPVEAFASVSTMMIEDLEVDRYGEPDGNLVYAAGTPFEQRGLPAEFAQRPYHRYRITGGQWRVVAVVSANGGHGYVLPSAINEYLRSGHIEEIAQPAADHPGLPPITDGMRAAAARNPGGWVYCADPDVDPRYIEGMPLPVMLGGYKVGPDGQFTGETYLNEEYRPSPRRRGYPEPQTDFELVLGFVAAGWLPQDRVLPAALNSPFLLETDGNNGLRVGVDNNGRRFLTVYSSPRFVPQNAESVMQTQGRELAPALAGVTLIVNPGGGFGIELPGDDLVRAAQPS